MPISPYIRQLRSHIGTARLLLPSVSAHIFDGSARLLLVRQADDGVWSTPGGLIEPDERPADAVVREVWEETGLLVRPERLAGVYGGPDCTVTYPNGDIAQYTIVSFTCKVAAGAPRPDLEETIAVRYWSELEAESLQLAPWLRARLGMVYRTAHGSADGLGYEASTWMPPEPPVLRV